MKFALCIEYDGSAYRGWQRQASAANTIQARFEDAIGYVANHLVQLECAGRTDAEVHATGQVISFETTAERDQRSWLLGINSNLPDDLAARWIQPVPDDFHARFSAIRRRYRYIIGNSWLRPALNRHRVSWQRKPLQVERMQAAAKPLLGEHDFTSFRTIACQAKSPVREIHELVVYRQGAFVIIDIEANGFLHHMVRNIAGVLMAIGSGEQPVAWSQAVLDARDRTKGGVTAPAAGLYLTRVSYPDRFDLPATPEAAILIP